MAEDRDGMVTDEQAEVLDKLADEETEDATGEEGGKAEQPYISFATKQAFQDAIDARLEERLERKDRKAAEEKAKAEAEARQKALEENQKFEELAEERRKEIETLQAEVQRLSEHEQRAERYQGVLDERVEAEMASVPDYIKPLLEGKDPVEKLTWLTENRDSFDSDKPSGSRPSPDPARTNPQQADKEAVQAERGRVGAAL